MRHCCALLILLFILVAPVRAQNVAGRALAATDRQPIARAFIVLLDEREQIRGGVLSDSDGRWRLRVPEPGRYRLRLERIGFDNVLSEWLQLGDSLTLHDIIVAERPLSLPAVRAESGGRGCGTRNDAEAVYRLWEEVQKALRLTRWTETSNALLFTTMTYVRQTNADRTSVISETRDLRTARAGAPFGTLTPTELITRGFSSTQGDALILHGIDARVLLSPEFVQHYCFRLESTRDAQLIGLAFQPMRSRNMTQVRGVLWVDRASAELRYMSYRYDNLPGALESYEANAEIHFRALDTGQWVIDRWWIRSPRLQQRPPNMWAMRSVAPPPELAGYHEDGGILMVAENQQRSAFQLVGGGAIEGIVSGRAANAIGPAKVLLTGTAHEATVDAAGRFRIVGVPPGKYGVTVRDGLLESLLLPTRVDTVSIAAGESITHDITWPTSQDILRGVCPNEAEENDDGLSGLLYGNVLNPPTGRPVRNARVEVSWGTPHPMTRKRPRSRLGFTNSDGRYYVCWVPVSGEVAIEVTAADAATRQLTVLLRYRIQRVDLR